MRVKDEAINWVERKPQRLSCFCGFSPTFQWNWYRGKSVQMAIGKTFITAQGFDVLSESVRSLMAYHTSSQLLFGSSLLSITNQRHSC